MPLYAIHNKKNNCDGWFSFVFCFGLSLTIHTTRRKASRKLSLKIYSMIDTGKQKITNLLTSVPEFSSLRMRLIWPFQPWSENKMQLNFFLFSFINRVRTKTCLNDMEQFTRKVMFSKQLEEKDLMTLISNVRNNVIYKLLY